jgi:hypothetical protein
MLRNDAKRLGCEPDSVLDDVYTCKARGQLVDKQGWGASLQHEARRY